jgi:hypothetical protein
MAFSVGLRTEIKKEDCLALVATYENRLAKRVNRAIKETLAQHVKAREEQRELRRERLRFYLEANRALSAERFQNQIQFGA